MYQFGVTYFPVQAGVVTVTLHERTRLLLQPGLGNVSRQRGVLIVMLQTYGGGQGRMLNVLLHDGDSNVRLHLSNSTKTGDPGGT